MPAPKFRSLQPPVLLPDGTEFRTWARPLTFAKTYYVAGADPKAADTNPGTRARPFRTIGRAAQLLQPGERVVVAGGVYRERVTPPRGGTGPERMISYQAAAGANVVLKGSALFREAWTRSTRQGAPKSASIWTAPLPSSYFTDDNPFASPNVTPKQFDGMSWAQKFRGKQPYTLPRGLVFQNGRRLTQTHNYEDLPEREGTFWVASKSAKLYVHPFGGADPNKAVIEITVRGSIFAPQAIGLGYIHVQGLVVEHSGNPFPMPQWGAISTARGHHWWIEGNTVRQVNGAGVDIGVQYWALPQPKVAPGRHIVRGNTVTDCGVCGIAGIRPTGSLIENNVLTANAFHDVERYWETAGIKTHLNENVLIRGNLVTGTRHGPGIWMDFANVNSRCTRNVLVGNTCVNGALFIEASSKPNLIDHNIIWRTRGNGIYEHDSRGQSFLYNLVGQSSGAGVLLRGKVTNRRVHGQAIVGGSHRVAGNVLVGNKTPVAAHGPMSTVESNLTEGVTATLNVKTLTLTWNTAADVPSHPRDERVLYDFFGRARRGRSAWAGPFGKPPAEPTKVSLRPALTARP